MHAIVYSPEAEKVRAFFADVPSLPSADAGGGWLIFALPPAGSTTVRAGSPGSHREIIPRGTLRGRMVVASACLSQLQLA